MGVIAQFFMSIPDLNPEVHTEFDEKVAFLCCRVFLCWCGNAILLFSLPLLLLLILLFILMTSVV